MIRSHSIRWFRFSNAFVFPALLWSSAVPLHAQATTPTPAKPLTEHLVGLMKGQAPDNITTQVNASIAAGKRAERTKDFATAATAYATASIMTPNFSQRDKLRLRVRAAVKATHRGTSKAILDSLTEDVLDRAFLMHYDTLSFTRATPSATERTVMAEYITGTQCGACWGHDRVYAALLKRYPTDNFLVLAYHDGPGYPIAYGGDTLWSVVASSSFTTSDYKGELYAVTTIFGMGDLGWINGEPVMLPNDQIQGPMRGFKEEYDLLANKIDAHYQKPPTAKIDMTLKRIGGSATHPAQVQVDARVTPNTPHRNYGIRFALVEDTVRLTGLTNRRLQYAAVRTVSWFGAPRSMFAPLPAKSTSPSTVSYTFDLAKLEKELLDRYTTDEDARTSFPDARDWQIQPRRLGVVAIVQDRDRKEVLQTVYKRVIPR